MQAKKHPRLLSEIIQNLFGDMTLPHQPRDIINLLQDKKSLCHSNLDRVRVDNLCYRLKPPGTVRMAKEPTLRTLRSQQRLLTGHITTLNQIACTQPSRPLILIDYRAKDWRVTFLYDLMAHLELAGIETLIWRPSIKHIFTEVQQELTEHHTLEFVQGCTFTLPKQVSAEDIDFCRLGYCGTLKRLIRACYNLRAELTLSQQPQQPLPKTSQFHDDQCELAAIVESRLEPLSTQHLLVKGPNASVTIQDGGHITTNATFVHKPK